MAVVLAQRPRVALNALFLHYPYTGTGRYFQQLARLADRWVELRLLGAQAFPPLTPAGLAGSHRLIATAFDGAPRPLAKVWLEQVALGLAARREGLDLLHNPYFAAPLLPTLPTVVTVHDLVPLVQPEYRRTAGQRLYTGLVSRGLRRAAAIITDSRASAQDLAQRLGLAEKLIRVIPLAVDPSFRPNETAEEVARAETVRRQVGTGDRYFLYVGGFDRRKNLPVLLEAFASAKRQARLPHRLVLVGERRAGQELFYDPLADFERLDLADAVRLPGRLADDDVRALHTGADAFVFPSLSEGFGLPPLEAMACGAPVICSKLSSLPEVVGDAGLLVDPTHPDQLAEALIRVAGAPELRRELSERGLARAARFTWEATVEATAAVYREVAGR
jgi:glycosyltransferase involved in cell wall biosynthesis